MTAPPEDEASESKADQDDTTAFETGVVVIPNPPVDPNEAAADKADADSYNGG